MKLFEHLALIASASTPEELEVATQAAWKAYPRDRSHNQISRAMRARGLEIVAASPKAHLIPVLGPRRRLSLGGEVYRVGYGQNAAGERYAWAGAREWIEEKLLAAGLSRAVAGDVISWWCGYPHRALASIELGGWRTDFAERAARFQEVPRG